MADQHESYRIFGAMAERFSLDEEEWNRFAAGTRPMEVRKGTCLIEAGAMVDRLFFCVRGLFRLYYTLEDGREYIKSFVGERDFVTSYGAMISGQPSHFSIQALEDSDVIAVPYRLLTEMADESHPWERWIRHCVEQLYMKKEERERELLYLDATDRYKAFANRHPGLLDRVPQYHIAAYLGISPVSLSRLMRGHKLT